MLFDVATIVSFLSQGTTLEPGSVIMTGTPEGMFVLLYSAARLIAILGVGYAMKPTPHFLKHGDQVEVFVEEIGTLKHGMVDE